MFDLPVLWLGYVSKIFNQILGKSTEGTFELLDFIKCQSTAPPD